MDKKSKYGSNNHLKYLKYFRNGLSNREKHAFEKSMMQDKFEEEAFEGLSKLGSEELRSDIEDLQTRLNKQDSRRRITAFPIFRYAAGIALLISIGSLVYILTKTNQDTSQLSESIKQTDSIEVSEKYYNDHDSTKTKTLAQKIPAIKESGDQLELFSPMVVEELVEMPGESGIAYDLDAEEIDDNYAIAHRLDKKSEFSGAISSTEQLPVKSVDQALQDRAEGVSVTRAAKEKDAESGAQSKVSVRGIISVDNSNSITGKVIDSNGTPVPGVSVHIKGTGEGVVTDLDGNFRLVTNTNIKPTLVISSIGYVTEEVPASDNTALTITMEEDLLALDEVVVVGYGSQKKSELAGSTATIRMDEEYSAAPVIIHPKPVGGLKQLKEYINESINYNNLPDFDEEVVIKLSFIVAGNGDLSNFEVTKSAGEAFDSEALRLIRTGPLWTPATKNGDPFEEKVSLKVKLQPEVIK